MRVHVISDMEGVAGIVKGEQTTGGEPLYEEDESSTRRRSTPPFGGQGIGATEIVVMDCHGAGKGWTFNSLIPEDLDPACEYVVQNEWTEYTEFLEQGCDAALFVGMHARAGTRDGVMSHDLREGLPEPLVQRHARGRNRNQRGSVRHLGLPRSDGDGATRRPVAKGGAPRWRTDHRRREEGFRRVRSENHPSVRARQLIEDGAKRALSDLSAVSPWDPGRPSEIQAEYKNTMAPDALRFRAGVERVDDRTIVSRADTWWEAWKQFYF